MAESRPSEVRVSPILVVRRNPAVFLVSAGFPLLAACNPLGGGGDGGGGTLSRSEAILATATARGSVPQPTPTPASEPTPTATPLPTPTPTPSPTVSQAHAESLVWSAVSGCAEQIAAPEAVGEEEAATAAEVNVTFASIYDVVNLLWIVDVSTADDLLSFGQWAVTDEVTPSVTPREATASRIDASDTRCALPSALLDDAPTPPLFLANEVRVSSAVLAATQVWTTVYRCFQEFPAFESFNGRDGLGGSWIVEGKSATTQYGLWEVEAASGAISPLDDIAEQVQASCPTDVQPAVVTDEEASIRAWVATYDCFDPHPAFDSFTARQEDPRRWVVEGRATDVEAGTEEFYGLWVVDTETGRVSGMDNLGASQLGNVCFKELP